MAACRELKSLCASAAATEAAFACGNRICRDHINVRRPHRFHSCVDGRCHVTTSRQLTGEPGL